MALDVRTKRVYAPAQPDDGCRVLCDRLWPRGMTKARAKADLWQKEVAPTSALRAWFGHDRAKWAEFKARYFAELDANPEAVARLLAVAAKGRMTLLFAAQDTECNQAVALREYLVARASKNGG
ncbi:MAG: DUF488 family protein [Lentisphaeria bacterium]|jgi:uncharacterized protein YeaO (DUF488 family)